MKFKFYSHKLRVVIPIYRMHGLCCCVLHEKNTVFPLHACVNSSQLSDKYKCWYVLCRVVFNFTVNANRIKQPWNFSINWTIHLGWSKHFFHMCMWSLTKNGLPIVFMNSYGMIGPIPRAMCKWTKTTSRVITVSYKIADKMCVCVLNFVLVIKYVAEIASICSSVICNIATRVSSNFI